MRTVAITVLTFTLVACGNSNGHEIGGTGVGDAGASDAGNAGRNSDASDAGGSAAADWTARISQPGVVWYHDFNTAAEVDAFRWTSNYGNDPKGVGSPQASLAKWVPAGGVGGGAYMQILRVAGVAESGLWWRPFSPIVAAGNGRGIDDPGCSAPFEHLTPGAYVGADHGSQGSSWGSASNPKPGWYGHPSNVDSYFDGTDFYVQVRVMMDPRRTTAGNPKGGKFVWLTTTGSSFTNQELVTYAGGYERNNNVLGSPNYHNVYQGFNYASLSSVATTKHGTHIQLGSAIEGGCDPYEYSVAGCWSYALDGSWDTLLYHVTPGRDGVPETRFEVWGAHSGQATYTKIWDVLYPAHFDRQVTSSGSVQRAGWNGLILSTYSNGFQGVPVSEFWHRFDQIIFSKGFIECPRP